MLRLREGRGSVVVLHLEHAHLGQTHAVTNQVDQILDLCAVVAVALVASHADQKAEKGE